MSASSCRMLDLDAANDLEIELTSCPDQLRITHSDRALNGLVNTVNQRDAFAVVVVAHAQKLAKDGDFDDDEENFGTGSRAVNTLMKIMSGFNKGEKHNPELAKILINCAKTRTGRIGEHKCEFQAAIRAAHSRQQNKP